MEVQPIISIIASAAKPKYWKSFFTSIARGNEIPFEIIFVGPLRSRGNFPKNFKFIKSKVKPTQCIEIAARKAKGEYILPVADDVTFSNHFLDKIYQHAKIINNDKVIILPTHIKDGENKNYLYTLIKRRPKSPVVGLIALYKTKIWKQLGGIDRRFLAVRWEYDLQMRFREIGGDVIIVDNCIFYEDTIGVIEETLTSNYSQGDKRFIKRLWRKRLGEGKYEYFKKRLLTVEPFDNKHIRYTTQGIRGKW